MLFRNAFVTLILALLLGLPSFAMTEEERRQYLEKLQQILPDVPSFREWLQKTGELPPDFDALPRVNGLPDPLQFLDGRPVRTARSGERAAPRSGTSSKSTTWAPSRPNPNSIARWCSTKLPAKDTWFATCAWNSARAAREPCACR